MRLAHLLFDYYSLFKYKPIRKRIQCFLLLVIPTFSKLFSKMLTKLGTSDRKVSISQVYPVSERLVASNASVATDATPPLISAKVEMRVSAC